MSKATILIVEDEAIIASDLASKLRRCDYDVVGVTARGEEAVDLAQVRRPDLVLMDIKLAGAMDGVTAAEVIRQQCDLPVIYLTAHSDHATLQRAKLTQPFGYILKPFEERELETHIEMALYKHQADRKLREQREWLRITLTSIGDAVIATDTTSRITFLNPVAESLTGWKEADAIGQSIASVFRIINEETREPADDVVERVLREGHVVGLGNHTALITRDGREIPIEDSAAPITDAAGKVSGVVLVFHDIAEKRRAEAALRRYELLAAHSRDIILFIRRDDGRILDANAAAAAVYGHSREEFLALTIQDLRAPDTQSLTAEQMAQADARGILFETVHRRKDGSTFPAEVSSRGATIDGTRTLISVIRDITERRRADEQRQSLARFPSENPHPVLRLDADGRILHANAASLALLRQWGRSVGSRAPAPWPDTVRTTLANGASTTVELGCEDRVYAVFVVPVPNAAYVNLYASDITERERVAEELARQREWLQVTLTSIGDAVIATDTDGRITFLNPLAEALTAWQHEEALGQPIQSVFRIVNEATGEQAENIVTDVLRLGAAITLANHTALVTRDGRMVPIEDSAAPIKDSNGRMVGAVVVFHDVTEKRRVQETITRERANLQAVFDVVNIGLLLINSDGTVRRVNNVVSSWFDRELSTPRNGQLGNVVGCVHAIADPAGCGRTPYCASCPIRNTFQSALRTGEPIHAVETEATVVMDGKPVHLWLEISADPLFLDGEQRVLLALRNITARKQAEDALQQLNAELEQRVAARTAELSTAIEVLERQAGQLRALSAELTLAEQRERRRLAEVLHDGLQQLLVAARVRAHMLGRSSDQGVQRGSHELVALLEEALTEARTLTGELSPPTLQKGGLLPTLEWLTRWMGEKHHLTVRLQPPATPVPVLGEDVSVLLYQAVRELLLNAVKYAQVSAADVTLRVADETLTLTVADTGVGFDPARLRVLGGTEGGFGLLGIRERLELLGGHLEIASHPGRGSRFTLVAPLHPVAGEAPVIRPREVPAAALVPASRPTPGADVGRPTGRRTRVLVVDDHALVRRGFATLLAGEPDLDVVGEAADGKLAIEMARQLVPDVILMDVSMPVLNGIEATRIIHGEFPAVRIIGLSVFDDPDQPEAMRDAGAVAYVRKNDPPEALLAAIRGVSTI